MGQILFLIQKALFTLSVSLTTANNSNKWYKFVGEKLADNGIDNPVMQSIMDYHIPENVNIRENLAKQLWTWRAEKKHDIVYGSVKLRRVIRGVGDSYIRVEAECYETINGDLGGVYEEYTFTREDVLTYRLNQLFATKTW